MRDFRLKSNSESYSLLPAKWCKSFFNICSSDKMTCQKSGKNIPLRKSGLNWNNSINIESWSCHWVQLRLNSRLQGVSIRFKRKLRPLNISDIFPHTWKVIKYPGDIIYTTYERGTLLPLSTCSIATKTLT